ncbi:hypothetical protein ACC754_42980, partial [Rhizobium johnstonii]
MIRIDAVGAWGLLPISVFARRIEHGTESREILERRAIRALRLAASLGGGLMVPMGFEYGAATPL